VEYLPLVEALMEFGSNELLCAATNVVVIQYASRARCHDNNIIIALTCPGQQLIGAGDGNA